MPILLTHLTFALLTFITGLVFFLIKDEWKSSPIFWTILILEAITATTGVWITKLQYFTPITILSIITLVTCVTAAISFRIPGGASQAFAQLRYNFMGLTIAFAFTFLPNRHLGSKLLTAAGDDMTTFWISFAGILVLSILTAAVIGVRTRSALTAK